MTGRTDGRPKYALGLGAGLDVVHDGDAPVRDPNAPQPGEVEADLPVAVGSL